MTIIGPSPGGRESGDVTLGEVYRLCQRIESSMNATNDRVSATNKRVAAIERDAIRMKTLWSAAVIALGFWGDYIRHKIGLS